LTADAWPPAVPALKFLEVTVSSAAPVKVADKCPKLHLLNKIIEARITKPAMVC
jgi:hypothetical protein